MNLRPTSPRVYLVLLHTMFLVLYGYHALDWPLPHVRGAFVLALATLTLLVLTVHKDHLSTGWFLGLLTLGNASVLFASAFCHGLSPDPWMLCAMMFLLAMASYATSLLHFALLRPAPPLAGLLVPHLGVPE
jgi:peptidoglycan/LPS O-acetylase OafA/YrhL